MTEDSDETVNAQLVTEGLARVAKEVSVVNALVSDMLDGNDVVKMVVALNAAQESEARMTPSLPHVAQRRCRIDDDPDVI
jgi:hypothetical protein